MTIFIHAVLQASRIHNIKCKTGDDHKIIARFLLICSPFHKLRANATTYKNSFRKSTVER
jgi:hypothetical protein